MQLPRNEGGSFTPPPAGNHIAICTRFIDLGTQEDEWQGKPKKQHKIILTWELCNEAMEDGRPFTISKRYTWSTHEKANLRHDLESWRGKAFTDDDIYGPTPFDIRNVLGKPCMLSVIHSEKAGTTYGNIASVAAMPKGMTAPANVNEVVYIALQKGLFDQEAFNALSDKLRDTIAVSPEYQALSAYSVTTGNGSEPPPASPDDYGAHDMGGSMPSDEIPF